MALLKLSQAPHLARHIRQLIIIDDYYCARLAEHRVDAAKLADLCVGLVKLYVWPRPDHTVDPGPFMRPFPATPDTTVTGRQGTGF